MRLRHFSHALYSKASYDARRGPRYHHGEWGLPMATGGNVKTHIWFGTKSVLMLGITGPDRSFANFNKAAMLESKSRD